MKKIIAIFISIILVFTVALFLPSNEDNKYDYLRLHIRANSNSSIDQEIKYEIRNELVEYLSPYFATAGSKDEAINLVNTLSPYIERLCDSILCEKGFSYKSNVKINNEYFPTRTYANTTLESGYYDAVIIELGSASGDNWWCVMYPPLCFVNKNESSTQIKFKSKIVEWFNSLFK